MSRRKVVRAVIQGPVEARRRWWVRGRTAGFGAGAVNRALLTEDGPGLRGYQASIRLCSSDPKLS